MLSHEIHPISRFGNATERVIHPHGELVTLTDLQNFRVGKEDNRQGRTGSELIATFLLDFKKY